MPNKRVSKYKLSPKDQNVFAELERLREETQVELESQQKDSELSNHVNSNHGRYLRGISDTKGRNDKSGKEDAASSKHKTDEGGNEGGNHRVKIRYTPDQLRQLSSEELPHTKIKISDSSFSRWKSTGKQKTEHCTSEKYQSFGSHSSRKWIPASQNGQYNKERKQTQYSDGPDEEDEGIPEWADETDFTVDKDLSIYSVFNKTKIDNNSKQDPSNKNDQTIGSRSQNDGQFSLFSEADMAFSLKEDTSNSTTPGHSPFQTSKFSSMFSSCTQDQEHLSKNKTPKFPPGLAPPLTNNFKSDKPESQSFVSSVKNEMDTSNQPQAFNESMASTIGVPSDQQIKDSRIPCYMNAQNGQCIQGRIPVQQQPDLPPELQIAPQIQQQFQSRIPQQGLQQTPRQIPQELPPPPPEMLELIRQGRLPPLTSCPISIQQSSQSTPIMLPPPTQLPSPDRLPPKLQAIYFEIQSRLLDCQRRAIMPPPQLIQQMQQFQLIVQQHSMMTKNQN